MWISPLKCACAKRQHAEVTWSHKLQQGVLLLPVSSPKKEVHHRLVFKARIAALKIHMPYQQPREELNSLFLTQNKKDRRVLKWGMYAKEWMSPVSTCLYSCACSLNVPVYPEPSSPILKRYPPPSTHFVFHVIYWGSETPVCGLQGLLSAAQSGLQKTGLRTVSKTTALKRTDGCCRAKARGNRNESRWCCLMSFFSSSCFALLVQSLIWKQLP